MSNKIAVITDSRGNYNALIKILHEIEDTWGDCVLVSLGGMIGEGCKPLETVTEIQKKFHHVLKNNAEKMLIGSIPSLCGSPYFEEGLKLAKKKCKKDILDWLKTLPDSKIIGNLLLQRDGTLNSDFFQGLEFQKKDTCITSLSDNEFTTVIKYLCEKKVHFLFSGIHPCKVFSLDQKWVQIKENYDFHADEAGNLIVIPSCGSFVANKHGYIVYDSTKNIFHIRYVKVERHDWIPGLLVE